MSLPVFDGSDLLSIHRRDRDRLQGSLDRLVAQAAYLNATDELADYEYKEK